MRRAMLVLVVAVLAGCCSVPVDDVAKQADNAARDFREVNVYVVPNLPDEGDRKSWTENMVTSAVRAQVMALALRGERTADQGALEAAELAAVEAARKANE